MKGNIFKRIIITVAISVVVFLSFRAAVQAACDFDSFKACANTFSLQGCINACPYVTRECPAGTSPNTECKETDKTCSDQCLTRADTHLDSCLKSNNCTKEEIQAGSGGNSPPPPPSPTYKLLSPSPAKTSPPTPSSPQEIYRSLNDSDFQEETEALADTKPQKNGESEREDPKCKHDAAICSVSGEVEILLPGSDTPIELSKGIKDGTISLPYKIPENAQVFTGDETIVRIKLDGGKATVTVDALSEFTLDEFNIERSLAQPSFMTRMRLKTGKVEVGIAKGEFTSDMKIATPQVTGAVTGTHFAVAYNETTGESFFELYDGTITVTHNKTGKTVALSSVYDKPIKRVEIGKDGEFTYKIGIPRNEWRKRQALWVFVAMSLIFIVIFGLYGRRLTKNRLSLMISLVKTNFNVGIIVVLVIGLLLGYVVYPFINPSGKQTPRSQEQEQGYKAPTRSDWKTFKNEQYGISFDYPTSWTVDSSSQVFESGDVVTVQILGETQKAQTEFYDGGRFVVMVPQATNLDLESWVNSQYSASDQISDVNINGVAFKKVYTCGLGCFTYYYTVINSKVYGINTFAEGSKKAQYQAVIDQMLKTLVLPK